MGLVLSIMMVSFSGWFFWIYLGITLLVLIIQFIIDHRPAKTKSE